MVDEFISIDITPSIIQVGSSVLYRIEKIDSIKVVKVKESLLSFATNGGRKYAMMMRFDRNYTALFVSRDKEKMDEVLYRIRLAISEGKRGNDNYATSITLNGNVINQSGDFEVGYSSGTVSL